MHRARGRVVTGVQLVDELGAMKLEREGAFAVALLREQHALTSACSMMRPAASRVLAAGPYGRPCGRVFAYSSDAS
jgi:hypothetical protein